ncbi:restriction endonuclease subunit S [Campylobacter sp. MIT 97-5078]|uniref:restriction endonuclease subunit S n=2 Tax=Campylobacter sp. MIT 97-5078 TaxID=1548153 RepID=UPI00163C5D46|nr:restriction endonuclease subunit S [Campylobacter sp. MIT 97-5078]
MITQKAFWQNGLQIALKKADICHRDSSLVSQAKNNSTSPKLDKIILESLPTPPPNGWELKKLGEILSNLESGKRPKGGVDNYTQGALSLGGEHIDNKNGFIKLESLKYVPLEFYKNYALQNKAIIKENDILICKDGALSGKIALVRKELTNQKAMINEHIFLLRCENTIEQKYIFYYLHSSDGQKSLQSKVTGSAQGGINQESLKQILIPLPPLEAQQKIVSVIEGIESKITNLEHLTYNLESKKQEILKEALES